MGMADLQLDASLPAGAALGELALHGHLQYTHGGGFTTRRVGDLQTVSNIDAPDGGRVMELWLEQAFGGHSSLRFGLYDLNSEFDAIDAGGLFINSSHGVGPDLSQSGANGPSIFPTTSLALRGEWRAQSGVLVRGAVLDAVPGDPDDPGRTHVRLDDGALYVLETELRYAATRLGFGGWLYGRERPALHGDGSSADRELGVYALLEHALPGHAQGGEGASVFVRVGRANAAVEQLGFYAGVGLVYDGGLSNRLNDRFGIAVGYARNGRAYRNAQATDDAATTLHETTIELAWRAQLTETVAVQPDIQYVINPGTNPSVRDAFIVGVRFEVSVSTPED